MTTQLPLRAGTQITLALGAANRDRDLWGADAALWRPSRWFRAGRRVQHAHRGDIRGTKDRGRYDVHEETDADVDEDEWPTSPYPMDGENETLRLPGVYSGM